MGSRGKSGKANGNTCKATNPDLEEKQGAVTNLLGQRSFIAIVDLGGLRGTARFHREGHRFFLLHGRPHGLVRDATNFAGEYLYREVFSHVTVLTFVFPKVYQVSNVVDGLFRGQTTFAAIASDDIHDCVGWIVTHAKGVSHAFEIRDRFFSLTRVYLATLGEEQKLIKPAPHILGRLVNNGYYRDTEMGDGLEQMHDRRCRSRIEAGSWLVEEYGHWGCREFHTDTDSFPLATRNDWLVDVSH